MTVMSHPTGCARTFFSAFPGHRRGPFVLTGLLMNQDHEIIRSLDDGAAVRHVLDVLQSVLAPRKPRWTPEEVMVMRDDGTPSFNRQDWEADEFARGGNSYISFRSEVDTAGVRGLREALRDPTASLPLFWAGEATAPAYNRKYQPLSVHGAYISGRGAAEDVAEFLDRGASREAFRESFARKRDKALAEVAMIEAAGTIEVALGERDLAGLRGYAASYTEGDLGAAGQRLLKMGIYLQEGEPKRLGGAPPSRPAQTLTLGLNAEEAKRVETWAESDTGGDESRVVRALLQRALAAQR